MARRPRLLFSLVILFVTGTARPADVAIAVIVHPARAVTLDVGDVARIFLKKQRFWEDGQPIVPLNREAGSSLRDTFSRRVFGSPSAALTTYWNEQYFLGAFPPPTLSSSEAVKRYVATQHNAIGYIESTAVDGTVRVALRLEVTTP